MTDHSPLSTPDPWDLVSANYAADIRPIFEHYAQAALELAAPASSARIVDVACGPGTLSLIAAERVNRVDALDFSPEMLTILTELARERDVTNIVPLQGDGTNLPYTDDTFDAGFSMFGVRFFPNPEQGMRELQRVVKPEGSIVVSDWAPFDELSPMNVIFPILFPSRDPRFSTNSEEAMHAAMEEAEIGDVQVHRVTHTTTIPHVESMWEVYQRSAAPIAHAKANTPAGEWAELSEKILHRLRDVFGEGELAHSQTALLSIGKA